MWAITSTTVSPDDSFIVSATSQEFGSSASAGGRGSGAQTEYAMLSFQTMSDRPCPTLPVGRARGSRSRAGDSMRGLGAGLKQRSWIALGTDGDCSNIHGRNACCRGEIAGVGSGRRPGRDDGFDS